MTESRGWHFLEIGKEGRRVMIAIHERFVIDKDGKQTAVLLDIEEYHKLLQELEELESLKAYDAAKSSHDEAFPFEQAIAEIEKQH